jgi:hypothetical protein
MDVTLPLMLMHTYVVCPDASEYDEPVGTSHAV